MFHILLVLLVAGLANAAITPPAGSDHRCQTCCCGTLHGDKNYPLQDRRFFCCGTEYYNPYKDTCCEGTLTRGISEQTSRCCGDKVYDPRHSTCCGSNVVAATPTEDQCCDGVAYNQRRKICCAGTLHGRGRNSLCCDDKEYNPYNQICCKGELTDGCTQDMRCCFKTGFDPHKQVCADPWDGTLIDSPALLTGDGNSLPCGDLTWVPCDDTCCPNGVGGFNRISGSPVTQTTGCCNGQAYNIHTRLCCAEHLKGEDVDPKKYQCCHDEAYNPHTHTCCDIANNPQVVEGVGLCCGPDRVFDPTHEICCEGFGGHVFPGCPSRTKCCYDQDNSAAAAYDTKHQLCCDGKVRPGGKRRQCCYDVSFDPKFEYCCNLNVLSRSGFRETDTCLNPTIWP